MLLAKNKPPESSTEITNSTHLDKPEQLSTINNRYKIRTVLGHGGMGIVYCVEDIASAGQKIALKTINVKNLSSKKLAEFRSEFLVMSRLKHPHLVQVYNFSYDQQNQLYYLTMEYVDGITLKDTLNRSKKLSYETVLSIIVTLARTLSFIHSRKIIHRDINPKNIMFTAHNVVKLLDFGIAECERNDAEAKGTPLYIAPEALRGVSDKRTDIFSLGITFYHMITHAPFYDQDTSPYIINLLKNKSIFNTHKDTMLTQVEHEGFRQIITRMVAYNPEERFQDSISVITAINSYLGSDFPFETNDTKEAYVLGSGFIGRQKELEQLKASVAGDMDNKSIIWVQGDAGIGKSRLFAEFKNFCQIQDIMFFEGSCYSDFKKKFSPFLPILGELLFYIDPMLLQKHGPVLKKILPDHQQLSAILPSPSLDQHTEHITLVQTITECIIDYTQSRAQGCVLYLNDMQWSDEGSVDILKAFVKKCHGRKNVPDTKDVKIWIYLSSRHENIDELNTFTDKSPVTTMHLKPFNVAMVYQYLGAIFGENNIGENLKKEIPAIHNKTGGNPFFLQELIKSAITHSYISRDECFWDLHKSLSSIYSLNDLTTLTSSRLQRLILSEQEQKALQIIALFNRSLLWDELKKIIAVDFSFILKLQKMEIIQFKYHQKSISIQIAHKFIQDSIVAEIGNKEMLHEYIAAALETLYADTAEKYVDDCAYHYYQAGNREKSIFFISNALKLAEKRFENEKTIDYYDKLLTVYENELEEKFVVLFGKIHFLFGIGKLSLIAKPLEDALKLSQQVNTPHLVAYLYYYNGSYLLDSGFRPEEAISSYEKGLTIIESIGAAEIEDCLNYYCRILFRLAYSYFYVLKDYEKALFYVEKGRKVVEKTDNVYNKALLLIELAQINHAKGNIQSALTYINEATSILREIKNENIIFQRDYSLCMGFTGFYHSCMGEYEKALDYITTQIVVARKIDNTNLVVGGLIKKADVLLALHDIDGARELCHEALHMFPECTEYEFKFMGKILAAKIEYLCGSQNQAVKMIKNVLNDSKSHFEEAKLYYLLWQMNSSEVFRNRALKLYNTILQKTSDYTYQTRLDALVAKNRFADIFGNLIDHHKDRHT